MTMEMWWLGFYVDRIRLAIFIVIFIPVLVGLSHYSGFEATASWRDDAVDAAVAYLVGFLTSAAVLFLFQIIRPGMPAEELIGKISIQAVPGSVGAVLAQGQLGGNRADTRHQQRTKESAGYGGEMFLAAAGAVFFAFNVAPTQEMIYIAFRIDAWRALALLGLSLATIHAFVYAVEFHGQAGRPGNTPHWSIFLRYSVVGYAVALCVSAYVLWTFGRFNRSSIEYAVLTTIVLGYPSSLGAAAARLIV